MPRAKGTTKTAKATLLQNAMRNGGGDAVVSSTTNGNSSDGEVATSPKPAVAKGRARGRKATAEAEVAIEKKPATVTGRGRKKPVPEENGVNQEVVPEIKIKLSTGRGGRSKKLAIVVEQTEAVPLEDAKAKPKVRARGRKASTVVAIAEDELIEKQMNLEDEPLVPTVVKADKTAENGVKGRKKKEPVAAKQPDEDVAEIEVAAIIKEEKETEETEIPAALSKKLKTENAPKVEKPKKEKLAKSKKVAEIDEIPLEKPAARGRKRGKAADIDDDLIVKAEDVEMESPNSKIKIALDEDVKLGKIKRGGRTSKKRVEEKVAAEESSPKKALVDKKPMAPRGRKRAVAEIALVENDDDEVDGAKPSKSKKTAPLNAVNTIYNKEDFDLPPLENECADGPLEKRYNLKVSSWNVAGLRSWLKKDGLKFLDYEEPDIFCLQETKCTTDQMPEEAERIPGYHPYWLCFPGGYAGVAIYSKIMPINVEYGIGNKEFDDAGRIITAEYEKFFLICVYVPNSGRKLVNLEPRMRWEKLFQAFVQNLDARKPVVICGDMNVSHQEIDLANPKANTKNAGFSKEERDKMTELLALGYVDTFRQLYPTRTGAYTFWTFMGNARSRNVGWRLDYFLVSERLAKRVVDNCIRSQCKGSDHCPITLFLKL